MIKAAFFDVDGTLLSHKSRTVPQSARDAVAKLRSAGIKCIVATGRQIGQFRKLPVGDIPFDGYITLNGQLTLDSRQKKLCGTPIEGKGKEHCLKMFQEHHLPALLVEEEKVYLNFVNQAVLDVQEIISTAVPPLGEYTGGDIYQVCAYVNEDELYRLGEIAEECSMARWGFGGVDIIAKGGGKVEGIRKYLEREGIAPEETIAFGDAENDVEMLHFAGIGVAMGNADEQVKAAADYVTADVDDDGIAKALEHFGLI